MTVMAAFGVILKGAVQFMTSITDIFVVFVILMILIVAVVPSGSQGRFAAAYAKVAFIAVRIEIMAIGTTICWFIAVKLGAFFIEPILAQNMGEPLVVAIVACSRFVPIRSV